MLHAKRFTGCLPLLLHVQALRRDLRNLLGGGLRVVRPVRVLRDQTERVQKRRGSAERGEGRQAARRLELPGMTSAPNSNLRGWQASAGCMLLRRVICRRAIHYWSITTSRLQTLRPHDQRL